jgi:lipoprotein-anchoring transpeptidase ErfK/SrfK
LTPPGVVALWWPTMRLPHRSRTLTAAALFVTLPFAGSAVAAEPAPPTVAASWTARAYYPAPVFKTPARTKIGALRATTKWSEAPAVYLITGTTVLPDGKRWVRVLLPGRPNGRQGWVAADAVATKRITSWIRVSTRKRTVEVYSGGVLKKRFRAAVGTGGTPTPTGLAAVQDAVATSGQLGPYILVLTSHSNVLKTFGGGQGEIALHGWPSSTVLGKAVSHGCVRMSRSGIAFVARFAKIGTPVQVV